MQQGRVGERRTGHRIPIKSRAEAALGRDSASPDRSRYWPLDRFIARWPRHGLQSRTQIIGTTQGKSARVHHERTSSTAIAIAIVIHGASPRVRRSVSNRRLLVSRSSEVCAFKIDLCRAERPVYNDMTIMPGPAPRVAYSHNVFID